MNIVRRACLMEASALAKRMLVGKIKSTNLPANIAADAVTKGENLRKGINTAEDLQGGYLFRKRKLGKKYAGGVTGKLRAPAEIAERNRRGEQIS